MASEEKTVQTEARDRVAQLLSLPCFRGKPAPVNRTGGFKNTRKGVFWQTIINDERPKLKLQVNSIEISDLVDTKTDL